VEDARQQVVEFLNTQCISTPPGQSSAVGNLANRETMLRWIENIAGTGFYSFP
jgi:hypothetical protein